MPPLLPAFAQLRDALRVGADVDGAAVRRQRTRVLQRGHHAPVQRGNQHQNRVFERRDRRFIVGEFELLRHIQVVAVDFA